MKKTKPVATISIDRLFSHFLYRFHFIIFIVIAFGGLAVIILLLSQTLARANDTSHASPVLLQPFDKQTIDKLDLLNTSPSAPAELHLPEGRINPFSE